MSKSKLSFIRFAPHLAALLLFIILAFAYFTPVMGGQELVAHDTDSWRSMAQESRVYNESHDDVTLWTNSMFGGMPNYQILMEQPYNVLQYVEALVMKFPRPVSNTILYLLCFYIMLLAFGMRPWQAIVGSIGFTFASYNFIIIAAGHNTKAVAIAYVAPLVGSVYLAYREKRLLGALLTALFLGLAIKANHIQILYYTLFILLFFGLTELVFSIKEKKVPNFLKSTGMMLVALVIAMGMNATSLLTTYEYSQYTMRGKSNGLTIDESSVQHGLNRDYLTNWSYGVDETLTVLIPDFKGGASGGALSSKSHTAEHLRHMGVPESQIRQFTDRMPLYWGTQPGTSGPVYFGAIVMFLFVVSLFVVDRRLLWWLIPVIILTMMLSWGRNFPMLTNFFIDHVPLYNKFRTPSMILVATGMGVGILAFMALKTLYDETLDREKLQGAVVKGAAVVGGVALLFALAPSLAGNFVSTQDAGFSGDYEFLRKTLPLDRKALLQADAWRSVMFILLAAFTLWAFLKGFLKKHVSLALIGFFILIDLLPVAKRYLNDDNFAPARPEQLVQPSRADKMVLEDTSQYRILDATVNLFNDASPSFLHKNIGGYHAAKLRRYQELINIQIEPEVGRLFAAFNEAVDDEGLYKVFEKLGVLNMLNMKYLIYNKEAPPLMNPYHNGNAWFVDRIHVAENADEEMLLLGEIDTLNELVVDKSNAASLQLQPERDSTATIDLIAYAPNRLLYHVKSASGQVAVFSEIYYDKGWVAKINGEVVPYTRVNYLLRGMELDAGDYELEFMFKPQSYVVGNRLAAVSSILFVLSLLAFTGLFLRKRKSVNP